MISAATQLLVVLISVTATLVATYIAQSGTRKLETEKLKIQNLENRRTEAASIAEEFIIANADFHHWASDISIKLSSHAHKNTPPGEMQDITKDASVHIRRISVLNGKLRLYADDKTNEAALILVECALQLFMDIEARGSYNRTRKETLEAVAYFQLRMRIYLGLEKETPSTPRLSLKSRLSPLPKLDQSKEVIPATFT